MIYDVIVIGHGLTGMLTAIWAKEQGKTVAIVHQGSGRIIQSTGLFDIIPGLKSEISDLIDKYQIEDWSKTFIEDGINEFKLLMNRLNYPYKGSVEDPVEVVTGSGHLKQTALYPDTIKPIPNEGHVVIVSYKEIADFQPTFVKDNLQKERPKLSIDKINISLGIRNLRTMTQLDAARLLEKQEIRNKVIDQINEFKNITQADLYIFPSVLGVEGWDNIIKDFGNRLGADITEAPGMPPNATAIRLNDYLRKEVIKLGVKLYSNSTVIGNEINANKIRNITVRNNNNVFKLASKNYVLATGGIIGGGIEVTSEGLIEKAIGVEINNDGELIESIENVLLVGASNGFNVLNHGITGGVYSILSSYRAAKFLNDNNGGINDAK